MAKRSKSSVLIASNLGRHALVFDEDDIVHLLRAAVEREGSQSAFARRHGVDRVLVKHRPSQLAAPFFSTGKG